MNYFKKIHTNYQQSISRDSLFFLEKNNLIYNNEIFYNDIDKDSLLLNTPDLKKFLLEYKLDCFAIGLIKIFYNKVAIHQDNSSIYGNSIRINVPIINCEKSETIFYKSLSGKKKSKILPNGSLYHEFYDSDCEEISRLRLDSIAALNVSIPHRVVCTVFPRIALTIHVSNNLDHFLS